ncbi:hypothetical protein X975_17060, partial [Stegodyphus mimosarum]
MVLHKYELQILMLWQPLGLYSIVTMENTCVRPQEP